MRPSAILAAFLVLSSATAFAADEAKTAPKPSCGKTVEECQKALEIAEKKVLDLTTALQGAIQQRNMAAPAVLDAQLQAYVTQQEQVKK